jgi:chromosomal replication initiation ATPase DnaA
MSDAMLAILRERHPERWHQAPAPAVVSTPPPRVRDWLLLASRAPGNHVQIKTIIAVAANYYGVSVPDLLSDRRHKRLAFVRQIGMYLARRHTPHSLPVIGRAFNRDYTTVLHSIRKIEGRIKEDRQITSDITIIQSRLGPPARGREAA